MVAGRQWSAAIAIHVSIVGRGGIAGSCRRSVVAVVCTTTAAAATALRTVIAYLPEAGFGFYDGGRFGRVILFDLIRTSLLPVAVVSRTQQDVRLYPVKEGHVTFVTNIDIFGHKFRNSIMEENGVDFL